MKNLFYFFLAFWAVVLISCNTNKKQNTPPKITGSWEIQSIQKMTVVAERTPRLKFDRANKQVSGNDGCNNIFGSIKSIDNSKIEFGTMGGTRMMCQNMETPNKINTVLSKIQSYQIVGNELVFFDNSGVELMRLNPGS